MNTRPVSQFLLGQPKLTPPDADGLAKYLVQIRHSEDFKVL